MKRENKITIITALIFITAFSINHFFFDPQNSPKEVLKIGFVYDGDESIPYTNNFIRAQHTIEERFGENIQILSRSNVNPDDLEKTLTELVSKECSLIFTTSYSHAIIAKEFARMYPKIHFCQASGDNAAQEPVLKNYHTFMGEIYQGRYVSGIVAGMKLKELIDRNLIEEDEAKVGYVGAYPYPEVISGFTAFLLGVRSIVPQAKMLVTYTYTWSSFSEEKIKASYLINEGCHIISQHSDTIGPAVACEEAFDKIVFHVGYNQSMVNIAPTTSLTSTRINWTPYITGAVDAILKKKNIEKSIKGHAIGTDVGAGFDLGWVQMLELNSIITAEGTEEKVAKEIQAFKKGRRPVFVGNYIGVNPYDEDDTCDLRKEFKENEHSSAPSFCYILKDIITVEE
ncbi:BMP family ABC transporter substrate-binding protein [uncultured Treponema sp.]|uniref:BMP family ABC transporter substrate-binding protein n=1 Tax=uncultured Treponema sp. TaxID=162155 RepID=UPI0025E5AF60|nr:BMP family ABC transporter substrate-binding protein [uncultured Treponema sp.]